MINKKKKRILHTILGLMCVVTIASSETLVYAAPSTEELEEKTSDLQGELNNMNSELASLGQQLDDTSSKIETLAADVEKAKLDLAAAQINEESQYEAMKDRIKFMYEGGNTSLIQILLTSENMGDFLNKAEYVNTINEYDRDMLEEFQNVCDDVEQKKADLETQQKELASLQGELTEKQDTLNSKIASASGELADYSAQLERAKAAAAALEIAQNNTVSGSLPGESDENDTTDKDSGNNDTSNKNDKNDKEDSSSEDKPASAPANTSEVALLAAILECEAGGSYNGMLAVGTVIMNRVESSRFPNTIKGVIYQSGQFSPVRSGKLDKVLARGPSSSAYSAAKATLGGKRYDKVADCLYFNAAWTGKDGINVGGNVFW